MFNSGVLVNYYTETATLSSISSNQHGMSHLHLTFWASQLVILCCKSTTVVIHVAEKLEFEMLMQMGLNNKLDLSVFTWAKVWPHVGSFGYVDLRGYVGLMYLRTLQMKFSWWCGWSKFISVVVNLLLVTAQCTNKIITITILLVTAQDTNKIVTITILLVTAQNTNKIATITILLVTAPDTNKIVTITILLITAQNTNKIITITILLVTALDTNKIVMITIFFLLQVRTSTKLSQSQFFFWQVRTSTILSKAQFFL